LVCPGVVPVSAGCAAGGLDGGVVAAGLLAGPPGVLVAGAGADTEPPAAGGTSGGRAPRRRSIPVPVPTSKARRFISVSSWHRMTCGTRRKTISLVTTSLFSCEKIHLSRGI